MCSTNLGFSGGSANRYCCRTLRQDDTSYVQYRATSKKKEKQNAQYKQFKGVCLVGCVLWGDQVSCPGIILPHTGN